MRQHGYRLRDLFIAILTIAVVLALTLPAIQAAREAARRTQCTNNLKNIVLGLHNYYDTYKMFPMGAMHSGPNPGGDPPVTAELGPSWWFGTIPFMEQCSLFDRILASQKPGVTSVHEFCADDMNPFLDSHPFAEGHKTCTHSLVREVGYMRCPSSSLPAMETPNGPIALPTYVGIAGACDIAPDSQDYAAIPSDIARIADGAMKRPYRNAFKGTGSTAGSIITASGMLPPGEHVTIAMCTDGTSSTMIVAEQSDWLRNRDPRSGTKYHGDAGWTVGGTGRGGGWLSGTARVGPVPRVTTPGGTPSPWAADCWNITTVRYPPNLKRVIGSPSLPGCSENHGINNPLQSAHPGGLLVGMVDGSVQFVSSTMELPTLLRLAVRLDAQLSMPIDERGNSAPWMLSMPDESITPVPPGEERKMPNQNVGPERR